MPAGVRLLLVDGLNLIRRVHAAQPGTDGAERAEAGRAASVQSLERALAEADPTHALVVFEGAGPTWRHRLFAGYKAGHGPMPEALAEALPRYRESFAALGVPSFELAGHEADDVVATLAVKVAAAGGRARILSTDRIYWQLLGERIAVRDHFGRRDVGPDDVRERLGVGPEGLLDLLALAGETNAGIAGVPGVGPKTAARLLAAHGSLAGVLAAAAGPAPVEGADAALSPRLAARLVSYAEEARLARRLLALQTDLELGINLKELRVPVR